MDGAGVSLPRLKCWGGVFRMHPDGSVEVVLDEIDGQPLPSTNFACVDHKGAIWIIAQNPLLDLAA